MLKRILRRCRRLLGRGWAASEFEERYRRNSRDAWSYLTDQQHELRLQRILAALPAGNFKQLLECGCAEGFLTRQLADRAEQVVACDLSGEAVRRATEYCQGQANVQFRVSDIRKELPDGQFDVCLMSDVLYYLAPTEISRLARRISSQLPAGGVLLIANEWNEAYRDLTHPETTVRCFVDTGLWNCRVITPHAVGPGKTHWIAEIRRI